MYRLRWVLRGMGVVMLAVGLAGCAAAIARNSVPQALEAEAEIVGMGPETIRFWGDQLPPNADALVKEK